MNTQLLTALLEKNAVTPGTVVTAKYSFVDIFGRSFFKKNEFTIDKILNNNNKLVFELSCIYDNETIKADGESILFIEGMDVSRYADIYGLHPDGTNKKLGKKRGRKPRSTV